MKLKNKFLLGILAVSMVCMILQPNISNAALQSNGGTPATKSLSDWMLQIRQMQELGGTLGRKDTVSTSDLTSNATDLDIHMEKNTEYGAMAILSASAYGNPNKIESGDTTTGNSTGIVINLNKEWVAAGNLTEIVTYTNASNRYKNIYTTVYEAKVGDAIEETKDWHLSGESVSEWLYSNSGAGLVRARSGSLFSYYGRGNNKNSYIGWDADSRLPWASRACIVVGTGI